MNTAMVEIYDVIFSHILRMVYCIISQHNPLYTQLLIMCHIATVHSGCTLAAVHVHTLPSNTPAYYRQGGADVVTQLGGHCEL